MSKNTIDTLEKLQDELDKELFWRKKEIEMFKLKILNLMKKDDYSSTFPSYEQKSAILILYADWEGFIGNAANLYVRYVFAQKIKLRDLKTGFWEIQLNPSFESVFNSKKQHVRKNFLDELANSLISNSFRKYELKHDKRYITTDSNLTFELFVHTLDLLGIDSDNFKLRQNYIDISLVGVRNKIAHGERGYGLDFSDFINLCDYILNMLDTFKEVIIDSAINKSFLYKDDNNV